MKIGILGIILGLVLAVLLHIGFILFGGLLFFSDKKDNGTLQQVDLLSEDDVKKEEQKKEQPEEVKTEDEPPPDAAEIIKNLEKPSLINDAPALDAASLSAIEDALNGQSGGGDFAQSMDFASGGRIGGTGKAGALNESLDGAFSLAEIDQRPRVVYQSTPVYPSEMRSKKLEAVVTVLFVVDATGKVSNPRVEKSTNPAFEKPAFEAVKHWKFEPGVKGGQRVACKMRVPIRFQPG